MEFDAELRDFILGLDFDADGREFVSGIFKNDVNAPVINPYFGKNVPLVHTYVRFLDAQTLMPRLIKCTDVRNALNLFFEHIKDFPEQHIEIWTDSMDDVQKIYGFVKANGDLMRSYFDDPSLCDYNHFIGMVDNLLSSQPHELIGAVQPFMDTKLRKDETENVW